MRGRYRKPRGRIIARYDYRDEDGHLLYQVRRYDPKGFSVHNPNGRTLQQQGRYRRVPYRLPDLLSADPKAVVFIVEGEKDVDRLWTAGLIATCNAFGGGAGKWTRGHSRFLRDRRVAVICDNDPTGAEHGLAVAKALNRVAASVRLIQLAGVPLKGDVSDWLDAGHTTAELSKLAAATPRHRPGRVLLQLPKVSPAEREFRDLEALTTAEFKRQTIYGLPIAPTEKLLLILLAERGNPAQEKLANYLGVTDRRVRQMVKHLCELGWLATRKTGRQLLYDVTPNRRSS